MGSSAFVVVSSGAAHGIHTGIAASSEKIAKLECQLMRRRIWCNLVDSDSAWRTDDLCTPHCRVMRYSHTSHCSSVCADDCCRPL